MAYIAPYKDQKRVAYLAMRHLSRNRSINSLSTVSHANSRRILDHRASKPTRAALRQCAWTPHLMEVPNGDSPTQSHALPHMTRC